MSILDKRKVLIPFLKNLLIDDPSLQNKQPNNIGNYLDSLSNEDIKINLWNYFGSTYPDVFIDIPGHAPIVIEVKEMSESYSGQIVEQCRDVRKTNRNFIYFLLTNDEEQPQSIPDAENELKKQNIEIKIHWRKWKQVWKWLSDIQNNKEIIGTTDGGLIEDLTQLLEDNGMKYFTGIKGEWFTEEVAQSINKMNDLYKEMRHIVLDLEPTLDSLELKYFGKGVEGVFDFEEPKKQKPLDDQVFVSTWIEIRYIDKKWTKSVPCNAYIFIGADLSELSFSVGFFAWDISNKEYDELKKAATKNKLYTWPEPSKKGKRGIGIYHSLIEGSSNNNIVTLEEIKSSLNKIRDFVRGFYKIKSKKSSAVSKKRS